MSDVAVHVDHLGKRYRIGQREAYTTLRDMLSQATSASLQRLGAALRWHSRNGKARSMAVDDHIWALRDVSLEIKQGEVVGVIGRNGAGKSTFLKILSRITEPTTGHADIFGRVGSLLEVGVGFHPELTGRENIYLNGAILGMRRAEVARKFDEIVAFAEVEKFIDTPVKHYSSGMYVRLAFAVAAHLEPEILLVDEVLAVGDAEFQRKCLRKMGDVSRAGRTVLFVSHSMWAIQQLCSRAILLNGGAVDCVGPVADVTLRYLTLGLSQDGERAWTDVASAPGDDVVWLRSVRVCGTDGGLRTVFTVRDGVSVEIEYEVLRACPLDAYIFLYNEIGVCVLVSIDNNDSPWSDTVRPPGVYRSTCLVPPDLLNAGKFSVFVYISQNLDKAVMHVEERDAVWFAVSDVPDPAGVRGNYQRSWPASVVRPRLPWTVERVA